VFSLDETCDVGHDSGLPVSDDYRPEDSAFTGTVDSIVIEIAQGAVDFGHLVDPQLRLSVALARQ
jgi:arylsulfatase